MNILKFVTLKSKLDLRLLIEKEVLKLWTQKVIFFYFIYFSYERNFYSLMFIVSLNSTLSEIINIFKESLYDFYKYYLNL